jgi:predicted O-methyltransferase YrrM
LSSFIDLREGDLRETLRQIEGPIDFVLADIWIPVARPALELVFPHLRPRAVVLTDNTELDRSAYADYLAFINDPAQLLPDNDVAVQRRAGDVRSARLIQA